MRWVAYKNWAYQFFFLRLQQSKDLNRQQGARETYKSDDGVINSSTVWRVINFNFEVNYVLLFRRGTHRQVISVLYYSSCPMALLHMQQCQSYADIRQLSETEPNAGQWVSIFWTGPTIEDITRQNRASRYAEIRCFYFFLLIVYITFNFCFLTFNL